MGENSHCNLRKYLGAAGKSWVTVKTKFCLSETNVGFSKAHGCATGLLVRACNHSSHLCGWFQRTAATTTAAATATTTGAAIRTAATRGQRPVAGRSNH